MDEMDELNKLLKQLRNCANDGDCSECGYKYDGLCNTEECKRDLIRAAADMIEEANKNWGYCSDMLHLAIRVSGLSMSALVQLYNLEKEEEDGKQ